MIRRKVSTFGGFRVYTVSNHRFRTVRCRRIENKIKSYRSTERNTQRPVNKSAAMKTARTSPTKTRSFVIFLYIVVRFIYRNNGLKETVSVFFPGFHCFLITVHCRQYQQKPNNFFFFFYFSAFPLTCRIGKRVRRRGEKDVRVPGGIESLFFSFIDVITRIIHCWSNHNSDIPRRFSNVRAVIGCARILYNICIFPYKINTETQQSDSRSFFSLRNGLQYE